MFTKFYRKWRKAWFLYRGDKPFVRLNQRYHLSQTSIQVFYGLYAGMILSLWHQISQIPKEQDLTPPGSLAFLSALPISLTQLILEMSFIPLLLAFFFPRFQSLRIIASLAGLIALGLKSSFLQNHHVELQALYVALAFCLIPTWPRLAQRVRRCYKLLHLNIYWFALLLFLLPYTLSGLWKLSYGMIWQFLFDDISLLSPKAMAYVTAEYVMRIEKPASLSHLSIVAWWLSTPLLWLATFWEVFAILPLFRPTYWRATLYIMVSFHLLSLYMLNIFFTWPLFFTLLFLYFNPLQEKPHGLTGLIKDFPGLGFLTKKH